jgi:hypothetical protein
MEFALPVFKVSRREGGETERASSGVLKVLITDYALDQSVIGSLSENLKFET